MAGTLEWFTGPDKILTGSTLRASTPLAELARA
jgi:hypothetical protein